MDSPIPTASPDPIRSVYVHAPFCKRRCLYCDFAVQVSGVGNVDGWLAALRQEWDWIRAEGDFYPEPPLRTLYVGGGTPSLLGPEAMQGLKELFGEGFFAEGDLEWTAEANPESLDARLAMAWRRSGLNRLSIGVQSFHEATLQWMGRLHGSTGALDAVRAAREVGFENLSIDLIFGLPNHLRRSWSEDLTRAADLGLPHISLYGLTAEPDTLLGRKVESGEESLADEPRYREEYLEASEHLVAAGYVHYEVSNFARPGFESVHSQVYWSGQSYLGLGNSAHSYRSPVRRWNVRDWSGYASQFTEERGAVEGQERLTREQDRLEKLWLALRTWEGLPIHELSPALRPITERWCRESLATSESERLRLTPEGWLVMDRLVVELDGQIPENRPA